jgi:hypothetical protein
MTDELLAREARAYAAFEEAVAAVPGVGRSRSLRTTGR